MEESLRYFILTRQASGPSALWFVSKADDVETILAGAVARMDGGRGLWTLGFDLPWTAPPEDVDLWERHGLRWAGGPLSGRLRLGMGGGGAAGCAAARFLEGLLAALAATAEEDLNAGRWEKRVSTPEGTVRFVLSLPGMLEPEEESLDFETPRSKRCGKNKKKRR